MQKGFCFIKLYAVYLSKIKKTLWRGDKAPKPFPVCICVGLVQTIILTF